MTVEAAALDQQGWSVAVRRLWRRIAHLMHAFYADVRTLRDHRPDGATIAQYIAADRHPVCEWFWAGIPRDGGHAVALGKPYLELWPEFVAAGEHDDGIVFVCGDDWRDPAENVFDRVGGVPDGLATQCSGYATGRLGPNPSLIYPPVWPFGITHDPTR